MRSRYLTTLGILHRTFRHLSPGQRAHILIRFMSCPFFPVVDALPPGRVLDVGGGHGLFARLAAESGQRRIVVVDPDTRKMGAYRHPAVSHVAGFDAAIRGTFDAVSIVDVLYRVPLGERDDLLARIAARVRPGGLLVMKEMTPEKRLKSAWNRFQESLNDRFLGITMGDEVLDEPPEDVRRRLERAGFTGVEWRAIDRWYPHPHLLYTARRA